MKKLAAGASVRDRKAAALDAVVKTALAKTRAAEADKMSELKALRLARDGDRQDASPPARPQRKTRQWP